MMLYIGARHRTCGHSWRWRKIKITVVTNNLSHIVLFVAVITVRTQLIDVPLRIMCAAAALFRGSE